MPRAKSKSRTDLLDNAMKAFWKIGFHVVSMNDLVRETGVGRGGIYADFANKRELFHACIDHYEEVVVTPSFHHIEEEGAGIEGIRAYFDALLKRFDSYQGVGVGCLVGNTLTQLEVEDHETREKILRFYAKLARGYRNALVYENNQYNRLTEAELDDLADYTVISVQGLWSYSRLTDDPRVLRQYSDALITFLELRLRGMSEPSSN